MRDYDKMISDVQSNIVEYSMVDDITRAFEGMMALEKEHDILKELVEKLEAMGMGREGGSDGLVEIFNRYKVLTGVNRCSDCAKSNTDGTCGESSSFTHDFDGACKKYVCKRVSLVGFGAMTFSKQFRRSIDEGGTY